MLPYRKPAPVPLAADGDLALSYPVPRAVPTGIKAAGPSALPVTQYAAGCDPLSVSVQAAVQTIAG